MTSPIRALPQPIIAAKDASSTSSHHAPPIDPSSPGGFGGGTAGPYPSFLARHQVAAFLIGALGIGWLSLGVAVVLDLPLAPFLLIANFVGLLGTAVFVTARVEGWPGVRRLFARAFRWRVRWPIAVFAVAGLPVTTLAVAAISGTAQRPDAGWLSMGVSYVTGAMVMGALLFNLWEETAWAGFVQTRLAARHGLLTSAALTAVPFAGIHLPLAFADHASAGRAILTVGVLLVVAVVFRTLAGLLLHATGGSVLVVAVTHASFNASGALSAVDGQWQGIAALTMITVVAVLLHRHGQPSRQVRRRAAVGR